MLTYNVAGLPDVLSPSRPSENIPQASRLMNDYDVVFAQEDFAYHDLLVAASAHAFALPPTQGPWFGVGDGLSLLSQLPASRVRHVPWEACNGYLADLSDCLADKGFFVATLELAPSLTVDAYNLHADAGSGPEDILARELEFEQLARYIARHSPGRALIVAGDTNLHPDRDRDRATYRKFLAATGLSDACAPASCRAVGIDRIATRSSVRLQLEPHAAFEDARFVDALGQPLSDHPALALTVRWAQNSPRERRKARPLAALE